MRKFTYSVVSILFLFAYGMILLHNIVPHQHSEIQEVAHNHHVHEDHHGHDHDHHSEHNDPENDTEFPEDWSHPFSGQDHLEEVTFNPSVSIEIQQVAVVPSVHIEPVYTASFDAHSIAHQVERPPILYEPPGGSSDPQRGPPSIV